MAFMRPEATYWEGDELAEMAMHQEIEAADADPGWYSRLSAAGYLDCTDWSGPFETEGEALDYICDLHEVDRDGEPLD